MVGKGVERFHVPAYLGGTQVRAQGEGVLLRAGDAKLVGEAVRGVAHHLARDEVGDRRGLRETPRGATRGAEASVGRHHVRGGREGGSKGVLGRHRRHASGEGAAGQLVKCAGGRRARPAATRACR